MEDENKTENNTNEENEEEDSVEASEEIYAENCATCHGDDLSGDFGPSLETAGNDFSEEEIIDIIEDGKGDMPAEILDSEEAEDIAKWLVEEHSS